MDNVGIAISPPGQLAEVRHGRLHVRRLPGFDRLRPTVICEAGLTMMSASWGWIAPRLATRANVVLYDRAGLGWSEESSVIRDAAAIARDLHELIERTEVGGRLFLMGHSMGAIFNRAYLKMHSERVEGLIWLDPSHPEQRERSRTIRRKMRLFFVYLEAANLLASRDMARVRLPLVDQIRGLPEPDFRAAEFFFTQPRHLRTTAREARSWRASVDLVKDERCERPLLVVSARKNAMRGWAELQAELATLSTQSAHMTINEASHISLLSNREHAERACAEIEKFLAAH